MPYKETEVSSRPRKINHWHEAFVVFLTKECKYLGWNDRTVTRIFVEEDAHTKRIVIEKVGQV